jgi:hypothetical protein
MMAGVLLFFAAIAVVCVVAGEFAEMPFRRRVGDAGRSRMPAPARPRLRA